MTGMAGVADSAASRYTALRPHLDERQRRLLLGVEAPVGRGESGDRRGDRRSPDTIRGECGPVAGAGGAGACTRGGRKKLTESDPELMSELKALVDPQT